LALKAPEGQKAGFVGIEEEEGIEDTEVEGEGKSELG
jgi:hypothetical protein